jgi:hypothetical protein
MAYLEMHEKPVRQGVCSIRIGSKIVIERNVFFER